MFDPIRSGFTRPECDTLNEALRQLLAHEGLSIADRFLDTAHGSTVRERIRDYSDSLCDAWVDSADANTPALLVARVLA